MKRVLNIKCKDGSHLLLRGKGALNSVLTALLTS